MTNKKLAIITILLSSLPAAGQGYGGSGLRNIPADDSRTLQDGVRSERLLTEWEFRRDHNTDAADGWEKVAIPHDWAIYGPFDRNNDLIWARDATEDPWKYLEMRLRTAAGISCCSMVQ